MHRHSPPGTLSSRDLASKRLHSQDHPSVNRNDEGLPPFYTGAEKKPMQLPLHHDELLPPRTWHQSGYHIVQLECERSLSWWNLFSLVNAAADGGAQQQRCNGLSGSWCLVDHSNWDGRSVPMKDRGGQPGILIASHAHQPRRCSSVLAKLLI